MLYVLPLLNRYNIVIFGGVDGYSRKVTDILHATVLMQFLKAEVKCGVGFYCRSCTWMQQQITEPQLHSLSS